MKQIFRVVPILWQYLIPQHFLSKLVARVAATKNPVIRWLGLKGFYRAYRPDLTEAVFQGLMDYENLKDLFTRSLKPGARSFSSRANEILVPCDGVLSQIGMAEVGTLIQAKGSSYALSSLLAEDGELAKRFENCFYSVIYLGPSDYHRFHMPYDGVLKQMIYVAGTLFSVNSKTVEAIPGLFAKNERVICVFETEMGEMILVCVGALIVSSVHIHGHGDVVSSKAMESWGPFQKTLLPKGAELGYFNFGSTIVFLWKPKSSISPIKKVQKNDKVRFGQSFIECEEVMHDN